MPELEIYWQEIPTGNPAVFLLSTNDVPLCPSFVTFEVHHKLNSTFQTHTNAVEISVKRITVPKTLIAV